VAFRVYATDIGYCAYEYCAKPFERSLTIELKPLGRFCSRRCYMLDYVNRHRTKHRKQSREGQQRLRDRRRRNIVQQSTIFVLGCSGQPLTLPNSLLNSGNLTVSYTLSSLTSATITVEGIQNANGVTDVLDTYTGATVSNRSVSLGSVTYDSFRFVATFAGSQQSAVSVSVSSTGNGAAFSANLNLTNVATQ
jgi:hypothetical protein